MNESVRLISVISDRSSDWLRRAPGMAAEFATELFAPWYHRALAGILLLAAFADFYRLNAEGYGNTYYAAAIKSMLLSWHNLFFVSFDPGGFVTIDKPPLGFWIQAASAKVFGFSGFSILLPEALAGVISVALLYHLVARTFGPVAGLLGALALAFMPVSVVTNRNNTIDSLLTLAMLMAAWAVLKAAETGQRGWLLAGAALVGLGFNIKMLEAFLILPALALLYLLAAPGRLSTRLKQLLLAGAVLVVISFSWITIVDLTPASARPYVGSSQTNSEWELAFGYNGLERLTGLFRGRGAAGRVPGDVRAPTDQPTPRGRPGSASNAGGFGGVGETGAPSPLRLFNAQLGTQVSWLLPIALLGLFATGWGLNWRSLLARPRLSFSHQGTETRPAAATDAATDAARSLDPKPQALILFGAWFLTEAAFFSVAGFFHSYYMVTMAPAVCALFGAGVVLLWRDFQRGDQGVNWHGWLLPLGIVLTVLLQLHLLAGYPAQAAVLVPVVLALGFLAAGVLLVICVRRAREQSVPPAGLTVEPLASPATSEAGAVPASSPFARWVARADLLLRGANGAHALRALPTAALVLGIGTLLFVPATWVALSITQSNSSLATAGPAPTNPFGGGQAGAGRGQFPGGNSAQATSRAEAQLVSYLEAHRGSTRYLLGAQSAMVAAPFILQTGQPVMALGGFSGGDPILTLPALQQRIASHDVRYFLLQGGNPFGFGGGPADLDARRGAPFAGAPFAGASFGGASSNATLTRWIQTSCAPVPASAWGGSSIPAGGRAMAQLYDCGSAVASAVR